jgi:hypothetical protein
VLVWGEADHAIGDHAVDRASLDASASTAEAANADRLAICTTTMSSRGPKAAPTQSRTFNYCAVRVIAQKVPTTRRSSICDPTRCVFRVGAASRLARRLGPVNQKSISFRGRRWLLRSIELASILLREARPFWVQEFYKVDKLILHSN